MLQQLTKHAVRDMVSERNFQLVVQIIDIKQVFNKKYPKTLYFRLQLSDGKEYLQFLTTNKVSEQFQHGIFEKYDIIKVKQYKITTTKKENPCGIIGRLSKKSHATCALGSPTNILKK